MAGYTRQSTFTDGDTITAALFNNEYDHLLAVFSNATGHKHDGSASEGPVIGLIGDAGETTPNNKVLIDSANNHIEFYIEVSSNPVQQLYIADGAILPVTDNDINLGSSSLEFKDLFIDGTANIDSLVADTADINGGSIDGAVIGANSAAAGTFTTVTTTSNVVVGGNLTVSGTTTTVNSNEVNIGDNIIVLNSDETGTPSQNGGIEIERGTSTNVSLLWNETNDYWTFGSNHLNFPDNSKAYFGDSNDLQIYHSSGNNFINAPVGGNLLLQANNITARSVAQEVMLNAAANGAVTLYYDNAAKLATASGGVTITGTATATAFSGPLTGDVTGNVAGNLTGSVLTAAQTNITSLGTLSSLAVSGDLTVDTNTLYVDSTNNRVGIGTTSPQGNLNIVRSSSGATRSDLAQELVLEHPFNVGLSILGADGRIAFGDSADNDVGLIRYAHGVDSMIFNTAGTERARIDSSGNLLLGNTSAGAKLDIRQDSGYAIRAENNLGSYFRVAAGGDTEIGGNLTVTGNATINGNLTFGNAATDTVSFGADIDSNIIPDDDNTYDLGSSSQEWKDLYIDGVIYADQIDLGDNERIRLGASQDLQIYHDTSAGSIIEDVGSGTLDIRTNGTRAQFSKNGTEFIAKFIPDGAVELFHDNSLKLATTSTGIDVTGTVVADGLNLGTTGNATLANILSADNTSNTLISGGNATNVGANYALFGGSHASLANVHRWRVGGTEIARFDASGNLGIGTTSPSANLHVLSSGNGEIEVERASGALINLQAQSARGVIGTDSNHELQFKTNSSSRMTINTSGNVGIGETNPDTALDVVGGSADSVVNTLTLKNDSTGNSAGTAINFVVDGVNDVVSSQIISQRTGAAYHQGSLQFVTRDSGGGGLLERMRIDSSGVLLVGKTGSSSATVGFQAGQDGFTAITRASAQPLVLNRTTNDGIIAEFKKDSTQVGTISISNSGTDLAIDNTRYSDRAGLLFRNGALFPRQNAANADNAIDLGGSGARFKDLYLGGNATIGGNLTVSGTTTTINTATLDVEDKNITVNYSTGDSSSTADGAGLTIQDAVDASTDASLTWNATDDNFEISHGLDFGDNSKARFGAGNDLQIYHDGSNSYIWENGTGNLILRATDFRLQDSSGNSMAVANSGGGVGLYHNASIKLDTTSTGIEVTGQTVTDGITLTGTGTDNDSHQINFVNGACAIARDNNDLELHAYNAMVFGVSNTSYPTSTERMRIDSSGKVLIGSTTAPSGSSLHTLIASTTNAGLQLSRTDATGTGGAILTTGDNLRFYTHSGAIGSESYSERMHINSSGNVGIGTTSPNYLLDVESSTASARVYNTSTHSIVYIVSGGTTNTSALYFGDSGANSQGKINYRNNGDSMAFETNSSEAMRIDSSGNVGIGTSSPDGQLDVRGSSISTILARATSGNSQARVMVQNDARAYSFKIHTNDELQIKDETADTPRIKISTGGNVSIGGDPNPGGTTATLSLGPGSNATESLVFAPASGGAAEFRNTSSSGIFKFTNTNGSSEKMRIDSSGRILINTTSSLDNNAQLHIKGFSSGHAGIVMQDQDDTNAKTFFKQTGGATEIQTQNNTAHGVFKVTGWNGTASAEFMRVDGATGNLSVGQPFANNAVGVFALPAGELRVKDSTEDGTSQISIYNNNVSTDAEQFFVANNLGDVDIGNKRGALKFFSVGSERARIDSSGNLCVNSSSARTTGGTALLTLATSSVALNIGSSNNECMYVRRQDAGDYAFQTYNGGNVGEIHLQPYGGSVGIGTTSPDRSLVVNHASDTRVKLQENGTDAMQLQATSSEARVSALGGSTPLALHTNGAERMRIDSSGNVAIGTTSATSNTGSNRILRMQGTGNNEIILDHTDGAASSHIGFLSFERNGDHLAHIVAQHDGATDNARIAFNTQTTSGSSADERMCINSVGRVGIGTTSPSSLLHLESASSPALQIKDTTNNVTFKAYAQDSNTHLANTSNHDLIIDTNNTERIRILAGGNVGIGTTSPSDMLHVAGIIRTHSSSTSKYIRVFGGNSGNFLDSYGNTLFIRPDGNSALAVALDTSGNVGIGTNSPAQKLDVAGIIQSTSTNPQVRINTSSGTGAGYLVFGDSGDDDRGYISYLHASDELQIVTNASEKLRINTSGSLIGGITAQVGIGGTPADANSFELSRGYLNLARDDTADAKQITFGKNGAVHSFIETTSSGLNIGGANVGIGTTSPSEKLSVAPDTDVSAEIGRAHIGAVGHSDYAAFSHVDKNSTGNFALMQHGSGETYLNASSGTAINFRLNNSATMKMTSTGLGIGTTSPNEKLEVSGNLRISGDYKIGANKVIEQDGTTTNIGDVSENDHIVDIKGYGSTSRIILNDGFISVTGVTHISASGSDVLTLNRSGSDGDVVSIRNDGTEVGTISFSGSTTSYNTSSDARLKDITGSARGLEVINELNPVAYDWKADGKSDEGLIAQEVKELVPNAVSGSEEDMYQMDYSKLVVHLVAGMQEQQKEIEELKKHSHSPKSLENMEGYESLIETIKTLKAELKLLKGGN